MLIHKIFGLHEHILDLARRLALEGSVVIAPDYLSRYGDIAATSSIDALRLLVAQTSDAITLATFDESFDVAVYHHGDLQRVAMTVSVGEGALFGFIARKILKYAPASPGMVGLMENATRNRNIS